MQLSGAGVIESLDFLAECGLTRKMN